MLIELKNVSLKAESTCLSEVEKNSETGTAENKVRRKSAYTSLVAHQAGAYPGFRSTKRLGVFLLPLGWDSCSSLPPAVNSPAPTFTPGWREAL